MNHDQQLLHVRAAAVGEYRISMQFSGQNPQAVDDTEDILFSKACGGQPDILEKALPKLLFHVQADGLIADLA